MSNKTALYNEWIQNNVTESYGTCKEVTLKMQEAFPELRRVRGHYYCAIWGERGHWWLIDENGNIVDPTKAQFPSKGIGHYDEWDESQKELTGICPNCGDYCYDGNSVCSEACHISYASYIMHGI